jgi:hypothetical protein
MYVNIRAGHVFRNWSENAKTEYRLNSVDFDWADSTCQLRGICPHSTQIYGRFLVFTYL